MFGNGRERTGLFIDGTSTAGACEALGLQIDFKRLLDLARAEGQLVHASYYALLRPEAAPGKALIDWLAYNGYSVLTKPARETVCATGRRLVLNSVAVDLAVQAMQLHRQLEHMVLFSGAGEFRYLLAALQRGGCRVTVAASRKVGEWAVADELRRQCDQFLELADIENDIGLEKALPHPAVHVERQGSRERSKSTRQEPADGR